MQSGDKRKNPGDKRRNPRRSINYPAYIERGGGQPAVECSLCDASQEGAQLAVADPSSLPQEFILALSSDGAARRRCRVMWRTDDHVGVEFLKEVKKRPSTLRHTVRVAMPEPAAAEAAAASEEPVQVDIDALASR
jgi:hypothetical protein